MKAVRMYAPGDLRVEEVKDPEIEEDEEPYRLLCNEYPKAE